MFDTPFSWRKRLLLRSWNSCWSSQPESTLTLWRHPLQSTTLVKMEGCSWRLSGKSLRNTNHGQWLVLVFPVLFIQLVGRILVRPSTVLNQQLHFYMAIYIFLYIYSCTVYQPIWRHFGCPTSFKFPPFSVKSYHGGWDRPERTWGGTTCSLALQHKPTESQRCFCQNKTKEGLPVFRCFSNWSSHPTGRLKMHWHWHVFQMPKWYVLLWYKI